MKSYALSLTIMAILLALALLGGSVLVWPAAVAAPELTPAPAQLLTLADWTV